MHYFKENCLRTYTPEGYKDAHDDPGEGPPARYGKK